jgi:hypothetical protein
VPFKRRDGTDRATPCDLSELLGSKADSTTLIWFVTLRLSKSVSKDGGVYNG